MHFLIQSPHAMQGIWQRPHHLVRRFLQAGHGVTWVQPRYVRWLMGERKRFVETRDAEPFNGFAVRTATLVNGERIGMIRRRNMRALAQCFPGPDATQGARVLWLYNPHEVHLVDSVAHDLLVYDIMDEYRGFPWSPPEIEAEEQALLARADWVFAGTRMLYEAKQARAAGKIECILSGVDVATFAHARELAGDLLARDRELAAWVERHTMILGYAGMLDLRIDGGLLERIARQHLEWGLLLLGPATPELRARLALPNVRMPGPVAFATLPAYYGLWQAALLPFVENELSRHINPTKMLEYAAAGVPIVARALPEVRLCYDHGAWLYSTHDECLAHLEAVVRGGDEVSKMVGQARGWIAGRDWDTLATRCLARVEQLLAGRTK